MRLWEKLGVGASSKIDLKMRLNWESFMQFLKEENAD